VLGKLSLGNPYGLAETGDDKPVHDVHYQAHQVSPAGTANAEWTGSNMYIAAIKPSAIVTSTAWHAICKTFSRFANINVGNKTTQIQMEKKMATLVEDNVTRTTEAVRSRISWAAILAGAAVAMAIYALLMSLGVAVGMSVDDNAGSRNFGTSAGAWSFISLLVSLFVGGWVTTQVTVGESRTEAVLYGVVLWATTSVLLLWLTANGIQAGAELARSANDTEVAAGSVDNNLSEPRQMTGEQMRRAGREGAWWAFAGILMSMVAAIGGALVGPVELTVRRDTRYVRDRQQPIA